MTPDERNVIGGIFDRLREAAYQPRDPEAERFIADRVREAIAGPGAAADRSQSGLPEALQLSVSVGVSGTGTADSKTLMDTADEALYSAKGEGRNRVVAADLDGDRPSRV